MPESKDQLRPPIADATPKAHSATGWRKVLFVHNGPVYRAPDGELFGTHITDELRVRYLALGTSVHFLMREKPLAVERQRLSKIENRKFSFTAVPEVLTPRGRLVNSRRARKVVFDAVAQADVVVARVPSLIARWAVHAARRLNKPYMLECVACNWDALSNHRWLGRMLAPWYFLAQKRLVINAPFVIYVTRSFLQERYPTRGESFSISNVVLEPAEAEVLDRRLHRIRAMAGQHRPLRLVTVASVSTPYKGQADIIAALAPLSAAGIACEYHLIGGGDQRRLQALAASLGVSAHVRFHGSVRHADIFSLLDEMDIYVQPSRQEGLPRAVIEAMSRGMPALGAKTGGIPELLPSDRVFKPGDTPAVLKILASMLQTSALEIDAKRNFQESMRYTKDRLADERSRAYLAFVQRHQFVP